ncbi:ABC transporter permease [Conexibacter woesei]|uniref:Binding-protein-dependent transport systems inner membrane component n=1 Tax=Conexibacter woesei (strain DSM 14684 / CCUG 47730 / CIP 108061 / JCM 11494 / NBRC 100937 / ID131577) TaxID=469383 RepID=D3F5W9_CONWI|nr:ABC transporter permease [Conexibacter woesei]ADB52668.1 binding-protein-dependent transport systems inner membrane component [Conexibacter woesei DSM 14684]
MSAVQSAAPTRENGASEQARPSAGARMRTIAGHVLPPLLFLIAILVIWQVGVKVSGTEESTLPAPTDVFSAMWDNRTLLADNAWVTIKEILIGYSLAIVLGVGLAVLLASSVLAERAMYPWLVVSQMVPIPAIAPILVIWTGFDMRPKVIVIMLVSFFPIAVNTLDGLKSTEPELLNLLKTLGAGRWKRFRTAQLPSSLPFLFSGLKIGAALSVIGAVFAEWVGADAGLGYLILTLNNQVATAEMFATIIVLAAIGIALFGLVRLFERLLLPWYHAGRKENNA